MKHHKLNIDPADLSRLYKRGIRFGQRLHRKIRKARKMKKDHIMTTEDVAAVINCKKEILDKYFYED